MTSEIFQRLVFDGRGAGLLDAGRLRHGRNGFHPCKKCRQHFDEEPDGLLHRYRRIHLSSASAFCWAKTYWASSVSRALIFSQTTQTLTGRISYSTWCSAPRPRPSFPAQWQNAQSSFPTAFTPVLSPLWYTPSKHTGSGAAAGFRSSASMILQAPAPSTW